MCFRFDCRFNFQFDTQVYFIKVNDINDNTNNPKAIPEKDLAQNFKNIIPNFTIEYDPAKFTMQISN